MQVSTSIIAKLNEILTAQVTAAHQSWVHARMCANWGYPVLDARVGDRSGGIRQRVDELITRILFLEGIPNMQRIGNVMIGQTVLEQLRLDKDSHTTIINQINQAIALCVAEGDHGSRALLESSLVAEESELHWLEMQLELTQQIGEAGYLAQQTQAC